MEESGYFSSWEDLCLSAFVASDGWFGGDETVGRHRFCVPRFWSGRSANGAWQRSDQEFLTAGRDGDKSLG